jgi:hypothetical protein
VAGGGVTTPTFEQLRDRIDNFYENEVGVQPLRGVEDHIYRRLLSGKSFETIEREVEGSQEYKTRYPGIEHQPALSGPQYDAMMRNFEAVSMENKGRLMTADEKRGLLAISDPNQKEKWIQDFVRPTSAILSEGQRIVKRR